MKLALGDRRDLTRAGSYVWYWRLTSVWPNCGRMILAAGFNAGFSDSRDSMSNAVRDTLWEGLHEARPR